MLPWLVSQFNCVFILYYSLLHVHFKTQVMPLTISYNVLLGFCHGRLLGVWRKESIYEIMVVNSSRHTKLSAAILVWMPNFAPTQISIAITKICFNKQFARTCRRLLFSHWTGSSICTSQDDSCVDRLCSSHSLVKPVGVGFEF